MMKVIANEAYVPAITANPGSYICFIAGNKIAVETFAIEPGTHEFNYEVNSRSVKDGMPEAVVTTRQALEREFTERRYVKRSHVPLSVSFADGITKPKAAITYGEVAPQVYVSKVDTMLVAWSIEFLWHRLAGPGGAGLSRNSKKQAGNMAQALGSAAVDSLPDLSSYLQVHIPFADRQKLKSLGRGFGTMDIIGTEQSLLDRWATRVFGP
ncbi:hypothetical protein [Niveispirillum sp. BGYR6]|jgi:hypothetical protein|uniref:hypothetical protein n=1 Tax=Niveispirillum sp. BGYR6 TaxID=2971249 RepID=UPI0022B98746|nr:hypothetical protein [Niveispirillum sp. BGYR6]MDG5497835.1 hypothetical protein [Niveispirillum sp. BGYR6]